MPPKCPSPPRRIKHKNVGLGSDGTMRSKEIYQAYRARSA